jgi:tetratricopeptide (TPR) repeat protein/tRNA A-37 threonylcarbamoyl transferase component Bud32
MHAERSSSSLLAGPVFSTHPQIGALLDDQSHRWQRGEYLLVEAYLTQNPGLWDNTEKVIDLIYHEILLRTRQGEVPQLEEYLERFPHLAGPIRAQFEVHQAISLTEPVPDNVPDDTPTQPSDRGALAWAAPLPAVPGYVTLDELGRGGMGVVYKARHVGLNRLVALKMIRARALADPVQVTRFRGEAEALARLQHPHIIQIYEVGEHEGYPYFALEFVNDGSLDQKVQGSPQPPRQAAQLVEILARAIQAAHARGIVHRDLKPANILLARSDRLQAVRLGGDPEQALPYEPKITDFGLAKHLDADPVQTRSGEILGTPSYMAPEQAQGRTREVGPAVDIYALGAILYELLTGRPPFRSDTVWDTLEQVLTQEPVSPVRLQAKVPRDLAVICLKCLHKEPPKRYASAADLADDLHRFRAAEPIRARPTPLWERAWKWARRRPAVSAACASTLAVLLVLATAHELRLSAALDQARQEAQQSEEQRNRLAAVAAVREGLWRVEAAVDHQHWAAARIGLEGLEGQLERAYKNFGVDPELAWLQKRITLFDEQVRQHLTDQDRYQKLCACRDNAAFYATGFAGVDPATNRRKLRELAGDGLRLFGVAVDSGERLALDSPYFTEAQRTEIQEGCYELLLGLAQALTESPGKDSRPNPSHLQEAVQILGRAARLGVTSAVYHERRAVCLERLGQSSEAQAERARGRAAPLTRAFEYFLRGTDAYRAGQLPEAMRCFEKALSLKPSHFGAQYALAGCCLRQRSPQGELRRANLAAAKARLTDCINQQPQLLWPYLLRGHVHSELEEFEAGAADFAAVERLLTQCPDDTARYGVWVNRGVMRIRQHDMSAAVADLTRAIQLKPGEYAAYVDLAQAYQEQQNWTEACRQLDAAIALNPPGIVAAIYRARARLHQHQGDLKAALQDLEQAIQHESGGRTSPEALKDLGEKGRILFQLQNYAEADQAFTAALASQADNPTLERLRADALLRLDRYGEAVQALDLALAHDRAQRRATAALYRARGLAQGKLGHYAAAAEDFTRHLELEPDNAADHARRGWTYVVLEAPTLALRDFERVVQIDPKNGDGYNGRGYALVQLGRYREAVRDAEKALRLGPSDSRMLYNAGRTFAQAALRVEADTTLAGGRVRDLRLRYQDQALRHLVQALDALPAGQRSSFWRQTVQPDHALDPLRGTSGFARLAESYAQGPVKTETPR